MNKMLHNSKNLKKGLSPSHLPSTYQFGIPFNGINLLLLYTSVAIKLLYQKTNKYKNLNSGKTKKRKTS